MTRFAEVNPALCQISGARTSDLVGSDVGDLTSASREAERRIVRAGRPGALGAGPRRAGSPPPRATPARFVAQIQDVTERRRFEHELEHLASHDALTGAAQPPPIRGGARARARPRPPPRRPRRGDHARHRQLQARQRHLRATRRATSCCAPRPGRCSGRVRATDAVGRLGGDEFGVVLLAPAPDEAARGRRRPAGRVPHACRRAGRRAHRARDGLGRPALAGARRARRRAGELLGEADMAMYDAKERRPRPALRRPPGRRRSPSACAPACAGAERIRDALESDRLRALRAADRAPVRRARRPLGAADPDASASAARRSAPPRFLPVAERYGQIQAIDRWVVRNGRRAARRPARRRVRRSAVEVNLSGDSITRRRRWSTTSWPRSATPGSTRAG